MAIKGLGAKQLTLSTVVRTSISPRYEILCAVERGEKGCAIQRMFSPSQLQSAGVIGMLASRNHGLPIYRKRETVETAKYNIFFRPSDPRYVRVDDLGEDTIDAMLSDGIPICCVVETSPDNYQAWLCVARHRGQIDAVSAVRILRLLSDRYDGDCRAVRENALGRLPGFFNRKPKHEMADGKGPLSTFHWDFDSYRLSPNYRPFSEHLSRQLLCDADAYEITRRPMPPSAALGADRPAPGFVSLSVDEAVGIYASVLAELQERFGNVDLSDRSACDFNVAMNLFYTGIDFEAVVAVLVHASEKAQGRNDDYVVRTVMNAHSAYLRRGKLHAA